jgi:hypothetical protein
MDTPLRLAGIFYAYLPKVVNTADQFHDVEEVYVSFGRQVFDDLSDQCVDAASITSFAHVRRTFK